MERRKQTTIKLTSVPMERLSGTDTKNETQNKATCPTINKDEHQFELSQGFLGKNALKMSLYPKLTVTVSWASSDLCF